MTYRDESVVPFADSWPPNNALEPAVNAHHPFVAAGGALAAAQRERWAPLTC
jgi:hypothetical protein